MPGRTKEISDETRRELLSAAIELFLEKGVARVTLEQIARAAGYTRGAIYHHFRNKNDILEELMESVQLPMEEFLLNEADDEDRNDPIAALQQRCVKAMETSLSDECQVRIHTILWHRCEFVEELNPIFRKIVERDTEHVEIAKKFFERAEQLGQLRPDLTPAEAAFSLYSFATGLHRNILREPWRGRIAVNIKLNLDIFFSGLRAPRQE